MKIKELISKYITKTTVIVGLVLLLFMGGYGLYNMNSKLSLVRSELAAAKLDKSIIEVEKLRLDSLIIALNGSIKERDVVIAKKDLEIVQHNREIAILKSEIWEDLHEAQTVSADSSYKYLNQRFEPTTELKFKFDAGQIKGLYYTVVERDGLYNLNIKYNTTINEYTKSSFLKNKQIRDLKELNFVYLSKSEIYRKENASYKIKVEGLDKQVKQQKFMKNVGIGAAVGLVTYIIINSISN